ncbi:MAG: tetratricopeptide repeat protein [Woeseiaceae bacterium]
MKVRRESSNSDGTHDCRGVPVSYANSEAIGAFAHAHESYLAFRRDPLEEIDSVIEAHPHFVLAHLFKAAYLTQIMETRVRDELISTVAAASDLAGNANDRELLHLQAVTAWIDGDIDGAVSEWDRALAQFPRDLLALQLVHLTHVLFGNVAGQRDVVGRVYRFWDESIDGFEFVLGLYAFGLEENREFKRAEQMAMRSLKMRADNPYAVHALCHTMDMQGRQAEGLQFMYDHCARWSESEFVVHLWWHTALLHLYQQDFERVLDIYDNKLRRSLDHDDRYEEFDASALLWRLELASVDVGRRWVELANKWAPSAADTLYAFNNVHAMMAFAADSREEEMQQLLSANEQYVGRASGSNVAAIRDAGLPFCRGIKAFQSEHYSECVEELLPIRNNAELLGGSFVQRDIMGWTLLEAALRSGQYAFALALAAERCELKPACPQCWFDMARAHEGLGEFESAATARTRAKTLLTEPIP